MHKARYYLEIDRPKNLIWQSHSVVYPGVRPNLFKTGDDQRIAYNKTIDQDNNVIPSFPIDMLNRNNKNVRQLTLTPDNTTSENRNGLPYEINDGSYRLYGNALNPTNRSKWIKQDYQMENGRLNTNPTNSDGANLFSTMKKFQHEEFFNRQPLPIYNDEKDEIIESSKEFEQNFKPYYTALHHPEIKENGPINVDQLPNEKPKEAKIYNYSDNYSGNIDTDDEKYLNTRNIVEVDLNTDIAKNPLKQVKHKFANIENDFNNNLPKYMQTKNKYDLYDKVEAPRYETEINPRDALTNKHLNNIPNKLLSDTYHTIDENTRPILSNQNKKVRENRIAPTLSHNPHSTKVKDNKRENNGINEPITGEKVGSSKEERTAIIRNENFAPPIKAETVSRNQKQKEIEENFKNNKYKMNYSNIIEPFVEDAAREEKFAPLRNGHDFGANMDVLSVKYMNPHMIENKKDTSPIIYNFNGYKLKNDEGIDTTVLHEFDEFKINDFDIITNPCEETREENKEENENHEETKSRGKINNFIEHSIKAAKDRINGVIKNSKGYNTHENIMEFKDIDTSDATNFEKIDNMLWNNDSQNKESFINSTDQNTAKNIYMLVLKNYARMLLEYVLENKDFAKWSVNWKHMGQNIDKNGWNFEILDSSDADVAYVENKGEKMRFRVRDDKRFVPISVYTYVLCHELAHLANYNEYGHGPNFQRCMHLLEVAAYELGIIKPEKYPNHIAYQSNGTTILTKDSIKQELYEGCNELIKAGADSVFYGKMVQHIRTL